MRRRRDPKFARRVEKAIIRANIFDLLETLGVKYKTQGEYGDLWLRCFLPAHKGGARPSFHIMANPIHSRFGRWKCFGCGAGGNVIEFVKLYRDIGFLEALLIVEAHQREEIEEETVKPIDKNPPQLPIFFQSPKVESEWEKPYLDYLYSRGIEWWQIQRHNIGYCNAGKYDNRVIIPVTLGQEFCTFVARTILDEKEHPDVQRVTSAKNGLVGLFGSNYINTQKPAIISEGWADGLAIERAGYLNSYSVQTNTIFERQMIFLKQFPYAIAVPDGDEGGNRFTDSLAPYIDEIKILIAKTPWGKDPAICSNEGNENTISNAKLWSPSEEVMKVEIEY